MSKIIAKISLICWGFFLIFTLVIGLAVEIPPKFLAIVSITLGLIISSLVGFNLYRIYCKEGLDFGWFLVFRKGFWRVLLGLAGLSFFVIGLYAKVFPKQFDEISETGGMAAAKLLVAFFWLALISTFLCWALICFSEAVGYLRLRNVKWAFGSFALGILWQLFGLLFSRLFLDVINDVFFRLSAFVQNWILVSIVILTLLTGLWMGRYENLKPLLEATEK